MLCKVFCACCKGLDPLTITVEVDVGDGISFFLVGLPDIAVKESLEGMVIGFPGSGLW
jgi:magnesium chelatase family protein